ncbi:MAG: TPM domain-containing protein [Lachnospiraceae bacterium]|nr:TPM domain-containing protein [Lachnospiraceae bacterium]
MTVHKKSIYQYIKISGNRSYKVLLLLLCLCLVFSLANAGTAYADSETDAGSGLYGTVYENPDTAYEVVIEDDAGLLGESEKNSLLEDMKAITTYGHVAFKSIDENQTTTASYARDYFDRRFGNTSGIVFLIDMDNREIYIFSDGVIYKTITSSVADIITDNVYSYASRGRYDTCASQAFAQIRAKLAGQRIAQPMKYISNAFLALLLALLVNYFFVKAFSRAKKPANNLLLNSVAQHCRLDQPQAVHRDTTRTYSPRSSGSSSHHSGSHHSGGGHRSSGHHGGGGGHRF